MRKLLFILTTGLASFLLSLVVLAQTQPAPNVQQMQQLLAQTKGGTILPSQTLTQLGTPPTAPSAQNQYLPQQIQQMFRQYQAQPPATGTVNAAAIAQQLTQSAAAPAPGSAPVLPPAASPATPAASSAISNAPLVNPALNPAVPQNATQDQQNQEPTMYDKAFDSTVNQLVPLSPDQITKLHEIFDETQLATTTPPGIPAKPTTSSIIVNLSPQAAPPVIRLSAGYITSLVFMDSTGQPWPIDSYSIGNPGAYNIQWDKKGNTLLMQAGSFYKSSNLAVILKDLNTPIMITLLTGQGAVDYRVDIRVPAIGPNAMFLQNGLPDSANPVLLDVLNGIPPKGSKALKVSGGACEAWILNNKLYLRTSLDVISPAWQAVMSSIDGTHAYELQPAPVILALQHGKDKVISLSVEGLE